MSQEFEADDSIVEDFTRPMKTVDQALVFDKKHQKRQYWLSDYALERVMANQNYVLIVTGTTGSGKSYGAMTLALDIDPYFNVDRIVFSPEDFVRIVKTALPPGSVIIWDEVGVGLSSREWFTIQNKMIGFILETFRRDNLILIMTTPNMSFIDKKVRSLLHGYAETIDPTFASGKFGKVKYFHIVVNLREGRIMYTYPRVKQPSGKIDILTGKSPMDGNMKFNAPPLWLTKEYEKKKMTFTEELKDKALDAMTMADISSKGKLTLQDIIGLIEQNPRKFGLAELGDTSMTDMVDNALVMLTLEYPMIKVVKSDITAAVKYLVRIHDGKFKYDVRITDKDLPLVQKLYDMHGTYAAVGRALNVVPSTISTKVAEWKKKGDWIEDDKGSKPE